MYRSNLLRVKNRRLRTSYEITRKQILQFVKSVFCFAVAPEMREQGIAGLLLERVCEDAQKELYVAGSSKLYKIVGTNLDVNNPSQREIKILPNPAYDFIQIDGFEHISQVSIFDSLGKFLKTINDLTGNTIDIKDLISGVYLFQVHADNLSYSFKLLKK